MTKVGRLVAKYYRANVDRHNLYCYRSRAKDKWTAADQLKLDAAKLKKKAASKELRTYLKKCGLHIVWGDRNQIHSIIDTKRRDQDRKNEAKRRAFYAARWAAEDMKTTLDKLDLV